MAEDGARRHGRATAIVVVGLCVALAGGLTACADDDPTAVPAGSNGGTRASDGPGTGGPAATDELAQLIEALRSGTRSERAAAAESLGVLGDPAAVPALVEALVDESWDVRSSAATAFIAIPDERAVEALLALIEEEPAAPAVSEDDLWAARAACDAAVEALGHIGDVRAVARLVSIATDQATGLDTTRAAAAVEAFGEEALPGVVEALDEASGARAAAVVTLMARLGEPALDPLLDALRDKRPAVRVAAAGALGGFGSAAVRPLIAATSAKGDELRAAAARSLGEIGDARATDALVDLLKDSGTRRAAVRALVAIHRDDAKPLVPYLKHKATVQVYRPLIRIGQKNTLDALVTALERFGTESMGETYLNCGEPRLEKAAKRWASSHGYIVIPGMGTADEAWGVP